MIKNDLMIDIHKKAKEMYPDFPEASEKICASCNECCSDNVEFTKEELNLIKKKHKKLFRGIEATYTHRGSLRLAKRTNENKFSGENKCVFFDYQNSKCKVYEERPQICKLYGSSPIASCGYEGLDVLPIDDEERKELCRKGKEFSFKVIMEIAAKKGISTSLF